MNKKTKIYLLLLVCTAAVAQFFINKAAIKESKIITQTLINDTENITSGHITAYSLYSKDHLNQQTRYCMVENLAKTLGITSDYSMSINHDNDNEIITLNKLGDIGDTKIKLITLKSTVDGSPTYENYFLTEITVNKDCEANILTLKKELEGIYKKLGMDTNTNLYLCSEINGQLSEAASNELIKDFLSKADANCVETISLDNVTCCYGYSNEIDNYVFQNDKRVNVNIAISYDESNDETRIYRAIPFIDKSF